MRRAITVAALTLAVFTAPAAHASDELSTTVTVDGTDYPVCSVEDCSDQPGQIGVWFDRDGTGWLSLGEASLRIDPAV